MQHIINISSKKIEDLEIVKKQLKKDAIEIKQGSMLNKKLANLLSRKIDQLEVQNENLQSEIEAKTKEIIKAERLSAMGELASRLAHDIRNPLSIIKGVYEIMKLKNTNIDKKTQEHYLRIDRAISRISHQLDNVLDFVRIRPLQFSNASVHEIIVASISSIKIPQNIIIENTVDDVSIVCDPKNIEIVFTNLILNAIQALIRSIKLDSWIVIEVEDDGPTIPDNVLSQIFDPLFTTKQTGTGLGLSSSKNIVEQHGGNITLKNNPTTFSVKLPLQLSVPKTNQQRDR